MAESDTTKIVISLETVLRNLNRTLRGLDQIKKKLDQIGQVKVGAQSTASTNRATIAAQKLAQQQQKLSIQTQELANRQERARQTAERLAQSQQRLSRAQERVTQAARGLNIQQDRHVQVFRAMEHASGQFNRTLGSLGNSLRSVGQGLASFGATLTFSVTAPLIALGASITNAAVRMDSLQRGLRTISGSSQEAAEQLERLTRIAKLPGIGFEEAIQGSIRLQAVGFSAEEAERALRQFSNAIALTGGGREQLENITVQLGQMAAQSKVLAQDLKPIISSAPAVAVALREAFGTVRSEELQELGISSKEFISILVSQLERLPRAAAGAKNSFENFRDELFRAAATVGTVLLPALTRLVEVAGPVVTALANAFAALPAPLQVIVVGFTGLLAIIGPVAFVVGQLTLGVGRLLVGFAELNATGILPTVASLRALTTGSLNAAAAQRTLAASTALVSGGVGLLLTAITAAVTGFALYRAFQKDSVTLSREQVDALSDQIAGLKEQAKFVAGLSAGVQRTADEQQRLLDIYSDLNRTAKIRITSISDEEQRLTALREELQRLIALREQERIQQAASLAAELANNLQKIQANENERDAIAGRIQANAALIETLQREQAISAATTRALAERGITAATVEDAIGRLKAESENLSASQDALISASKELNDTAKDQVAIVRALEQQTGLTARELLVAAQGMGRFRGDVAAIIPVLERYIQKTEDAANATNKLNRALSADEQRILEAGQRAEDAAKRRDRIIRSSAAVARETAVDFTAALKSLREMVDAVPSLRQALERERELTGKSLDELLRSALEDAFKGRAEGAGTGLRNAQEQLARALADSAQASAEELGEIERAKNDRLLQANENLFRLQLISYRQYLSERARLTNANIQLEINAQRALAQAAADERDRLIQRSKQAGIPPAESTRARAQAAAADAQRIAAETRIVNLRAQQQRLTDEVEQSLAEAQRQQFEDVRALEREYAELRGRIEDALNAATDEKFRETLQSLVTTQKDLNQRLEEARIIGDKSAQIELEQARALNQRQIEAIEGIVTQERALNRLAAANELVTRAKDKQAELERQLTFEVEFRGLSEEQAIARRLAGERKVADSLRVVRDLIQEQINLLNAQGAPVPQALLDFIRETRAAIQGLGELSFSEQFRLAEKEFNRINDERIQKIQDVERAVRNRDIAEIEGLILVRRINNQYAGDLERQLELLRAIAEKSNQDELRTRTADIGETVKDAKDEVADFDRQLRAVSIDSLQDSLGQFFKDLRDNSENALQDLLSFLDRIATAISDLIAENLAKEFIESIFPDPNAAGGGVLGFFKRMMGIGGGEVEAVAHGAEAAEHAVAATALTTGATAAAAALTTGGATAGATVLTSLTAAATAFSTAVVAAGAAFAAAVAAAASAAQAIGGIGSAAGFGAATGLFPAVPGGMIRIVEGGYPEAVITTDPRHAARQVSILRELIAKTRGFYGRIPEFASGGIVSRETAEANLLSSINRAPQFSPSLPASAMETAGGVAAMNLRIVNQLSSREVVRPYMSSEEFTRDVLNVISTNSNEVARRLPIGRR